MNVASRPVSAGKTRTCPHCKATILESLSICPGCMHHLRFDSEAAKRQVAAQPALRVEGIIRHPPLEQPLEYFVIIAIRNDRGEEVTRQVVNVGALQAAEKRTFTLSVEVLPPSAPVPTKSGASTTSSTGSYKSPIAQPSATIRSDPSASTPSQSTATGASTAPGGAGQGATGAAQTPTATGGAATGAGATGGQASSGATSTSGSTTQPTTPGQTSASRPGGQSSVGGRAQGGAGRQTPSGSPAKPSVSGAATRPGAPGTGQAAGQGTGTNSPAGKPGVQSPAAAAPGSAPPSGSTTPSSSPTPTSGYVLKPPSPGGPKRH